jgi:UrcA family protein
LDLAGVTVNRFITLTALTCAAAGSFFASAAWSADDTDAALGTVTIRYSREELQSREGIRRLYDRLGLAAREVCQFYDSTELARRHVFRLCVSRSLDRAVTQIHDPALSAYHLRQVTRPLAVAALGP